MHHVHQKKYKNGLRVLIIPLPDALSVTTAVFVEAGTAYEQKHNNGISHFLEHMCFKGTPRRPLPIDITATLEGMGASYNAFTSRDMTGYHVKVAPKYAARAFDVIADIYLHATVPEQEIEKEKGVIIEEIRMYEDEPRAKVSETLESLLYGDQPAGWHIAGTPDTVMATTREAFMKYREAHYVASKTIVVIAGAVDVRSAQQWVEKYFTNLPQGKRQKNEVGRYGHSKPSARAIHRALDQTHFALGFHTVPLADKRRFALSLLAKVLGSGMSSRLFQKVREEMGAAYYIGAANNFFKTHGYLEVYGGLNHEKVSAVLSAVAGELRRIKETLVPDNELKRVKDYTAGKFLLSLETSDDLAFSYGQDLIETGKVETPAQAIARMRAVSAADIRRVAQEFLTPQRMNLTFIGPYQKTDEDKFLKMLTL